MNKNSDLKEVRFEFLLTPGERTMLRELAYRRGISCGELLRSYIRKAAGRKK